MRIILVYCPSFLANENEMRKCGRNIFESSSSFPVYVSSEEEKKSPPKGATVISVDKGLKRFWGLMICLRKKDSLSLSLSLFCLSFTHSLSFLVLNVPCQLNSFIAVFLGPEP